MPIRFAYRDNSRSAADLLRREARRESPEMGSEYLAREIESLTSGAMPAFESRLQDIREGAIRRGTTGGDLITSYEGDLASAFQRNISNEVGSRALELYEGSRNRYLDLLTGERDYDTYLEEQRRRRKRGLLGAAGAVGGGIIGGVTGGPAGAAAGARIGGTLGGLA